MLYELGVLGQSPIKKRQRVISEHKQCEITAIPANDRPSSHEGSRCQICHLELRPDTTKNVGYCPLHNIRVCTLPLDEDVGPILNWMCPNREWSCSRKFHDFYLHKHVFGNRIGKRGYVTLLRKGEIYKERKKIFRKFRGTVAQGILYIQTEKEGMEELKTGRGFVSICI